MARGWAGQAWASFCCGPGRTILPVGPVPPTFLPTVYGTWRGRHNAAESVQFQAALLQVGEELGVQPGELRAEGVLDAVDPLRHLTRGRDAEPGLDLRHAPAVEVALLEGGDHAGTIGRPGQDGGQGGLDGGAD